ncbi:hypothetical protein HG531_004238 [Fusarium graminearum]|nr:hypothetical protein HG531_004238 [Fusarium graminearum]
MYGRRGSLDRPDTVTPAFLEPPVAPGTMMASPDTPTDWSMVNSGLSSIWRFFGARDMTSTAPLFDICGLYKTLIKSSPPLVTTMRPSDDMSIPLVQVWGLWASRISPAGREKGLLPLYMTSEPSRADATSTLLPPWAEDPHATAVILVRPAEPAALDLKTITSFWDRLLLTSQILNVLSVPAVIHKFLIERNGSYSTFVSFENKLVRYRKFVFVIGIVAIVAVGIVARITLLLGSLGLSTAGFRGRTGHCPATSVELGSDIGFF